MYVPHMGLVGSNISTALADGRQLNFAVSASTLYLTAVCFSDIFVPSREETCTGAARAKLRVQSPVRTSQCSAICCSVRGS